MHHGVWEGFQHAPRLAPLLTNTDIGMTQPVLAQSRTSSTLALTIDMSNLRAELSRGPYSYLTVLQVPRTYLATALMSRAQLQAGHTVWPRKQTS
ncbi:protease [Fusarium oxysporum f. sp. raphani 54005]|uniref:Protease n=1 Tax=Fusarium oxysporum f. sp. raphani 54005 TaxID=1089458 RepID=X0B2W3_FUSOX|nr:protease [Fusarium oxysporum f. sp. raphani 54005]